LFIYVFSESQSSDDYKTSDRDQPSSSSTKKRKVLSMAEYVGSKQPKSSLPSTVNSTQNTLTDTQIKEIYAEFNAKCEELVASAPNLAKNVNKKLTQNETTNSNRNDFIANGHNLKITTNEQHKDIWAEEEDDDDDNNHDSDHDHHTQHITTQSQPIKNNQIVNNNHINTQQVE
jgi:hypothetical protein